MLTCSTKSTYIFSDFYSGVQIVSQGKTEFQQSYSGGVGSYEGIMLYERNGRKITDFISISFETKNTQVGNLIRLETLNVVDSNSGSYSSMFHERFAMPYLKNKAVNHVSLGYINNIGFIIGSVSKPYVICSIGSN